MRITFKRVLVWGSLAFCLFIAWFAWQLMGGSGPITVSPQTTVLTEPLAEDGLPDYARAMLIRMREGVGLDENGAENNGAIPFLQAMWPLDLKGPQQMAVCRELDIDLPDSDGMREPYSNKQVVASIARLIEPPLDTNEQPIDETLLNDHALDLILYAGSNPWRGKDLPPLEGWVNENASSFKLLHEAAERSQWYLPSYSLLITPNEPFFSMMLPHVQVNRSAWRCLLTRANYHLGEGDLAAAWRDCKAVYELADNCEGQFLVGELVSIAGVGMANHATLNLLDDPSLTPEVALQIHTYLHSRTPRRRMADSIDHDERLGFVTSILGLSGQRPSSDPTMGGVGPQAGPMALLAGISMDWDLILTIGNGWYDKLVEAMRIEDYTQRTAALNAIETQMQGLAGPGVGGVLTGVLSRNSRSKSMANVLASLLLPAVSAASAAEDRANIDLKLMQTAAALAVHKRESGVYPASLAQLTPKLLPQPPIDLFTVKPLVYKKTAAGYLLYSPGPNGKDDGGSNETRQRYLGYEVDPSDEAANAAVCELLGEPARKPIEGVAGREDQLEPNWLKQKIPPAADDHALRLPLPRSPLPKFERPE